MTTCRLPPPCRAGRLAICSAVLLLGCVRTSAPPPGVDAPAAPPPDVSGMTIMVLPAQPATPISIVFDTTVAGTERLDPDALTSFDAELAYWLTERGVRTRWIAPEAVIRAIARSPTLGFTARTLAVGDFERARMEIIGEPLYGELRWLSGLMNARYALVPVGIAYARNAEGDRRVHVAAALIDTMGGHVLWFGVLAGDTGAEHAPGLVASAARELAMRLVR